MKRQHSAIRSQQPRPAGATGLIVILLAVLLSALPLDAQDLPDAPQPKAGTQHSALGTQPDIASPRDFSSAHRGGFGFIAVNLAMWASTAVNAHATYYGSRQCFRETGGGPLFGTPLGGGLFHPWRKALEISLPLDAGVSLTSIFLHRHKHPGAALLLPSVTTAAQLTVAAMQYTQGCF
jgi:hypothetical protein